MFPQDTVSLGSGIYVCKPFPLAASGQPGHVRLLAQITSACRWVLVTNGDNEYASTAFSLIEANQQVDVVALDFYSRYQRVTGPPCDRFAHYNGLPPCKVNR